MHGTMIGLDDRTATPELRAARQRIEVVDLLRGLVILLMVLDHVRDFFHAQAFVFSAVDADRSNPALFTVRWITHLCAPVFVALAGASAYLQRQAGKPMPQVRKLLWTRGLWLITLELTVVTFGFNFGIPIPFLQVIWAIGWSMIGLSLAIALRPAFVLAIGLAIIAGHNFLDPIVPSDLGSAAFVWQFLHEGGPIVVGKQPIGLFAYPILPWIGVMFLGFGTARAFLVQPSTRGRLFTAAGAAMLGTFVLVRTINIFGDPDPWSARSEASRTVMAFLDVEKYPPSLLYLLATLGLALMLTPLLERLPRAGRELLRTYGSVPLLAYVAHLYVAHGLMMVTAWITRGDPTLAFNFIIRSVTDPASLNGWGFGLPHVFAFWVLTLALLYPLCRAFQRLKQRRRDWWLSYL